MKPLYQRTSIKSMKLGGAYRTVGTEFSTRDKRIVSEFLITPIKDRHLYHIKVTTQGNGGTDAHIIATFVLPAVPDSVHMTPAEQKEHDARLGNLRAEQELAGWVADTNPVEEPAPVPGEDTPEDAA